MSKQAMAELQNGPIDFRNKHGLYMQAKPGTPPDEPLRAFVDKAAEEFGELLGSCFNDLEGHGEQDESLAYLIDKIREIVAVAKTRFDIVAFADACADVTYVVVQGGLLAGFNQPAVCEAVWTSNATKPVSKLVNGHVQKPAGFVPPDIRGIIFGCNSVPVVRVSFPSKPPPAVEIAPPMPRRECIPDFGDAPGPEDFGGRDYT